MSITHRNSRAPVLTPSRVTRSAPRRRKAVVIGVYACDTTLPTALRMSDLHRRGDVLHDRHDDPAPGTATADAGGCGTRNPDPYLAGPPTVIHAGRCPVPNPLVRCEVSERCVGNAAVLTPAATTTTTGVSHGHHASPNAASVGCRRCGSGRRRVS